MFVLPLLRGLKRSVAVFDFVIFTIMMYALSYLPKPCLGFYPHWFRRWCKCFIDALGVELYIHEQYLGKLPNHFIVISNHPSAFEDLGMSYVFKVRFLAKRELKEWYVFGRIATAANTLYVKRDDKHSRLTAISEISEALINGENVGVYPEGGCFGRRIKLPFHNTVFGLAMKTKTPIIPVFLHYESQAQFEWQGQHLVRKIWEMAIARNPRVNYYIHQPIQPENYESKEALTTHIEQLYIKWQKQHLE